jgi:parallel beta-helix repeat protein
MEGEWMNRVVFVLVAILCLLSVSSMTGLIQIVKADSGTITINADGSITPSTAPIYTADNITYTLTGNVSYPAYNGIVVERNSIVIDGNGYMLQGPLPENGLTLMGVSNVTVKNVSVQQFHNGIYLMGSNGNIISWNTATDNVYGIALDYSSNNNTVSGNTATTNGYDGIDIISYTDAVSLNNTISGNNATGNPYGIILRGSSKNTVSDNNATENSICGIDLINSSSNIVSGNNATTNSYAGIYLSSSSNNTVSGNTATTNGNFGIDLDTSLNNTIIGNNATANSNDGIYLYESSNNTVNGNNATANSNDGIYLYLYSNNNIVSWNNATANSIGIHLENSSNNAIYHNNFIGNPAQASVDSASVGNAWDNGYPSGGNYWSDYNATDLYSGQCQNVTGSDGIRRHAIHD